NDEHDAHWGAEWRKEEDRHHHSANRKGDQREAQNEYGEPRRGRDPHGQEQGGEVFRNAASRSDGEQSLDEDPIVDDRKNRKVRNKIAAAFDKKTKGRCLNNGVGKQNSRGPVGGTYFAAHHRGRQGATKQRIPHWP